MVTGVSATTGTVFRVKVALFPNVGTVTGLTSVASELLLLSVTTSPPFGGLFVRFTVPVVCNPPGTDDGENVRD